MAGLLKFLAVFYARETLVVVVVVVVVVAISRGGTALELERRATGEKKRETRAHEW